MDERDLATCVHDLPGELFNQIYQLTFTAKPGVRKIDKTYKPPSLLAVDRASRKLFAKSYYGGSGASFAWNSELKAKEVLIRWLRSLTPHHRRLLTEVEAVHNLNKDVSQVSEDRCCVVMPISGARSSRSLARIDRSKQVWVDLQNFLSGSSA